MTSGIRREIKRSIDGEKRVTEQINEQVKVPRVGWVDHISGNLETCPEGWPDTLECDEPDWVWPGLSRIAASRLTAGFRSARDAK